QGLLGQAHGNLDREEARTLARPSRQHPRRKSWRHGILEARWGGKDMNSQSNRRAGALALALYCSTLATALALWPSRGSAEGALAVGVPRNVAESGVAIGYSYDYATAQEATEAAMTRCRQRGNETTPSIPGL